jgi:hypothetical protein
MAQTEKSPPNKQQLKPVVMEGMRIIFRNFKGEESQYNREGVRNFGVILPPEVAEAMRNDGWNVKQLKASEEELEQGIEEGPPWLPVEAAYDKGRPPQIVLITSRGKTNLDEDTVEQLDWVDIATEEDGTPKVDLIVRPYFWTNAMGASGIKAYLKSMYVTIEEDDLARKYAEMNEQ